MSKALLVPFEDIVKVNRRSRKIMVMLPNDARFFFHYDTRAGRWKEFLASRPINIVSEEDRACAYEVLNLYLYVLT